MRVHEIRALSYNEMNTKLQEAYRELFNLRFRNATGQLVDYTEIRRVRKRIARIKTIMREMELGIK